MRYAKTESGVRAIKDRHVPLTAKQRAALVLCDAKLSHAQLLQNLAAVGSSQADLEQLKELGLVSEIAEAADTARQEMDARLAAMPPAERFKIAYPIATRLAGGLGLKGFTLTLAVERSENYEQLCAVAQRLRGMVAQDAYQPLHAALYQ